MNPIELIWNNEYFRFAGIVLLSLIAAQLFLLVTGRYFTRLTSKTKTDLDDRILKVISRPIYLAIFFTGLYIAFQYLTVSEKWTAWIDHALFIILILLAASIASELLLVFTSHWLRVEKRYEKTPRLVGKIISILIYLLSFIMVLNHFKINITPIIATLGIGGLAAGLALQSTLSNFFAGLHIITDRSFTVGDLIEIAQLNVSGHIEDIGWRTTRVKTLQNTIAIVPNSKLAESVIINTELPEKETSLSVVCGVAYDSDLEKVETIVRSAALAVQKNTEGAVAEFIPDMKYTEFGESNIMFTVTLKVQAYTFRPNVRHDFIKNLKTSFDAQKINISFPVRKIISG
jgi:small-conductance mechanosensitive channel